MAHDAGRRWTAQPGSHETGLRSGAADVVLAVQALHWMEPEPTFREVRRILRRGGVFAAIDWDWPPVVGDDIAEQAWDDCRQQIRVFETRLAEGLSGNALRAPVAPLDRQSAHRSGVDGDADLLLPDGVRSWAKSGHLDRMLASGQLAWGREVAMASSDEGDAARFVGLLESQGDYQTVRRHGLTDAEIGVDRFRRVVLERLGDQPRPWRFVYRARLAFAR